MLIPALLYTSEFFSAELNAQDKNRTVSLFSSTQHSSYVNILIDVQNNFGSSIAFKNAEKVDLCSLFYF